MLARVAAALLLLALAALLLRPGAAPPVTVTWDDLIAPYGPGKPVTRGYVLSPPRRGGGDDIVYVARRAAGSGRPPARIEIHILARGGWADVAETRSFGLGWEVPARGALVETPEADALAVIAVLAEALAQHDTGFASVDAIPLPGEPEPPLITRVVRRLSGPRGALIAMLVAAALVLIASVRGGTLAAGALLLGLGLALRVPALDLPFVHDQDVQRLLTSALPLPEILTGFGLRDRHPPLYFLVLHGIQQWLGQSEAAVRVPAVLAGALAGPAILAAAAWARGRAGAVAVLAALAATVSPALIAHARQVSDIPLFALLLVCAAAALVAALRRPTGMRLVAVALAHAVALFTYYLAPFAVAAHAAVLAWWRGPRWRVGVALAAGTLLGAPALALGALTLVRDWQAREVARAFPGLAWGEHDPLWLATVMGRFAVEALGLPLALLVAAAMAVGVARRDVAGITPAAGTLAVVAGIALLSPIARVQAYYVMTVLPLALLALACAPEPARPRGRALWTLAVLLAVALGTASRLGRAGTMYIPDAGAFMPRFAAEIAARPDHAVVTVAHYDVTLLAYYLARMHGRPVDWNAAGSAAGRPIRGLLQVHALAPDAIAAAERELDALLAAGPVLVVERDAAVIPSLSERLSACDRLLEAPTARLLRCAQRTARAGPRAHLSIATMFSGGVCTRNDCPT